MFEEKRMSFDEKWALLANEIAVVSAFVSAYTTGMVANQGKRIGLSWTKVQESVSKFGGNAELAEAMKFTFLTPVSGDGKFGHFTLWYLGTAPKSLNKKGAEAEGGFVPEA